MHPHLSGDPSYLERFHREARLAASITHPNVIRIFEVGEDGDTHFISMEYLALSVHDLIDAQGQLPIDRAVDICLQTALAMESAHKLGIVHRDIKPQNILLAPDGTAKVSDFGIARAAEMSTMTRTGALMGTPHYMAPEQAQGKRADVQSDLYSLGVVLYQMLTGEVPFDAETPWEVIRQHIEAQPKHVRQVRNDVPKKLEQVVSKALEKDRKRRFQDFKEIRTALERAVPQMARQQPRVAPAERQVPQQPTPQPPKKRVKQQAPAPAAPPARPRGSRVRRFVYGAAIMALVAMIAAATIPAALQRPPADTVRVKAAPARVVTIEADASGEDAGQKASGAGSPAANMGRGVLTPVKLLPDRPGEPQDTVAPPASSKGEIEAFLLPSPGGAPVLSSVNEGAGGGAVLEIPLVTARDADSLHDALEPWSPSALVLSGTGFSASLPRKGSGWIVLRLEGPEGLSLYYRAAIRKNGGSPGRASFGAVQHTLEGAGRVSTVAIPCCPLAPGEGLQINENDVLELSIVFGAIAPAPADVLLHYGGDSPLATSFLKLGPSRTDPSSPAVPVAAAGTVLVSDSSWKASDEQQSGWNQVGFDDDSWTSSEAPWEHWQGDVSPAIGMWYPGAHERDATWFFFRKGFSIPSVAEIAGAKLTVQVDDDYVVYINGEEVAGDESGFTESPTTYDVLPRLAEGENVIAITASDTAGGVEGVAVRLDVTPAAAVGQKPDRPSTVLLARALLEDSYEAMQNVTSFRFEGLGGGRVETANGDAESMGWGFEGDFLAPDRSQGELFGRYPGFEGQVEVITVGGTTYVRDTETGDWHEDGEGAVQVPQVTVGIDPSLIRDIVYLGRKRIRGEAVHHLEGVAPKGFLPGSDPQVSRRRLEVELWIGVQDSYLRRVILRGDFGQENGGKFAWSVNYMDFGHAVAIEAPEMAPGSPEAELAEVDEVAGDAPARTKVVHGDWIIRGEEEYEGTEIEVAGRIVVTGSGSLRLDGSVLVLDGEVLSGDASAIDVLGGHLSLNSSEVRITGPERKDGDHRLIVSASGGTVSLVDIDVPFPFMLSARDASVDLLESGLEAPRTRVEMNGGTLHVERSKIAIVGLRGGVHEVVESRLGRVEFRPDAGLTLTDTDVSVFRLELPPEGRFLLAQLGPSAEGAPHIGNLDTGEDAGLALQGSHVDEWAVVVNGGHATIEDSSIGHLLSRPGSEVVVDSSTIGSWELWDRAEVVASRVDVLAVGGHVAPVTISLSQAEVGVFEVAPANGDGSANIDLHCDECVIDGAVSLSGANLNIVGDIEILASRTNVSWEGTSVTRSYDVTVSNEQGTSLAGVEVAVLSGGGTPNAASPGWSLRRRTRRATPCCPSISPMGTGRSSTGWSPPWKVGSSARP